MPFWGSFTSSFGAGRRLNFGTPTPTYSLSAPTSVDENDILFVDVTTTNVSDDTTLYWTILDETTDGTNDFPDISGSFTITGNGGTIAVSIWADITTEGPETFRVQIRTDSISGEVVATTDSITLNDTSITQDPPFTSISWGTISKPTGTTVSVTGYVAFDNKIIITPQGAGNNIIWVSTDGGNFNSVTLPSPAIDQPTIGIARDNQTGRLVILGEDATATWTSTDNGNTWTAHDVSITKPIGYTFTNVARIAFVLGLYRVILGNLPEETDPGLSAYSEDGITWFDGVLNPSIKVTAFTLSETDPVQNQALWGDEYVGSHYYYIDPNTPDNEIIVQALSPSIQVGTSGVKYASDMGWLVQKRQSNNLFIEPDITALTTSSPTTTHNGNGEAIGVLDYSETNRPSVVLIGPWTASNTWRINFNLADGDAWQNTTMPASFGAYDAIISLNGKFYVFHYGSTNVYVGTPSA